jgi:hypothetical protein
VTTDQELHTASLNAVLPLWRLFKQGHDASCEVAKIPIGFEGRVLLDGRFLYSHQYTRVDAVLQWAQAKQVELRQRGWSRVMQIDNPAAAFLPSTGSGQALSTGSGQALSTGSGQALR